MATCLISTINSTWILSFPKYNVLLRDIVFEISWSVAYPQNLNSLNFIGKCLLALIQEQDIQYSSHPSIQKTQVTLHALRKFEDNSCVGLVRHEKHTARERLLTSLKYS